MTRVLVLGVTGMLGNALFRTLARDSRYDAWGTMRRERQREMFDHDLSTRLVSGIDVLNTASVVQALNTVRPQVVINGVGVVKQLSAANDPLVVLPVNAMFPHQLAGLCTLLGARLVQLSTDCVFSGRQGAHVETDVPDAEDMYGKSKSIGELHDYPHAVTLRTSGIGHELTSRRGLLEWFLSQDGPVKGYAKAIYSGLPSVELAAVIRDVVLQRPDLHGLYHVSSAPISKLDLLRLVARVYGKATAIIPDDALICDRSLNSDRFKRATGYVAKGWPELVAQMYASRGGTAATTPE